MLFFVVVFCSPPMFSPSRKISTPTLGNTGLEKRSNSVSSPVQRKNGGTDYIVINNGVTVVSHYCQNSVTILSQ